ncbi:unnamed protein product [Mytilus coruscus]|uniref:Uncharacterized protein n=1 Tax=Mytilus coruscus TaxID=42192 RepID=A0A6J8C956_MYTCO|nr:unnamed protein product [Mytilus coruscus]
MSKMLQLKPSEIFYSQDSISNRFGLQPPCSEKLIGKTLDELLSKSIAKSDIPNITVVMRDGKFYTADNRRLWVFQKAEEARIVHEIDVKRGTNKNFRTKSGTKFTTSNGGISIRIRGDPGGVIWRTLISKPNVFWEDNENKLGNTSLRVQIPSVIRKTEVIEDNKSATDVRRSSIYKSSDSNNFSPKLRYSCDDTVSRNMESPVCGKEIQLSYMTLTKYEEKAKVCSKSFVEVKYNTDPSSLNFRSAKDKRDHSRLLSTPTTPRLYAHTEQKSFKEYAKENKERQKALDRPTIARCNKDTSLTEVVINKKDSIKSHQHLKETDTLKLKLLLLKFLLEVRLLKLRSNQRALEGVAIEMQTCMDKFINFI